MAEETNKPWALQLGLAVAVGCAVSLAICKITGRREAWDAGLYFTAGKPVLLVAAYILGRALPGKGWIPAFGLAAGNVLSLAVYSPGNLGLWPLALLFSVVISIPEFLAGSFGASRRRSEI
jgi:hypothetical protein